MTIASVITYKNLIAEGGNRMIFEGALIKEHGVSFGVVVVTRAAMHSPSERERILVAFRVIFKGIPVVLMAQDPSGIPEYFGRDDISKFLSRVPLDAIPWKKYTIN
jgi:hypothetical protein